MLKSGIQQEQNVVNKWLDDALKEQKEISLRQSNFRAGNPFMKGSSAQASDELNANSIIKIKKSDLDKLLKSFSKQKSDLESL